MVTTPALLLVVVLLLVPGWARAVDFKLKLPTGLQEDAAEIPDDNPISPEKIALGKKFYWDKRSVGVEDGRLRQLPPAGSRLERSSNVLHGLRG